MPVNIVTVRGLREHAGKLVRSIEYGEFTVVAERGKPVFISASFDKEVMASGVLFVLAARYFHDDLLSLGKAAHLAGCSTPEFIDYLGKTGIPVVHYPAEEIEQELRPVC